MVSNMFFKNWKGLMTSFTSRMTSLKFPGLYINEMALPFTSISLSKHGKENEIFRSLSPYLQLVPVPCSAGSSLRRYCTAICTWL